MMRIVNICVIILFAASIVSCSHDIGDDKIEGDEKEIINGIEVNWMRQLSNEKRESIRQMLLEMVKVEGGTFVMGATQEQSQHARLNEYPAHAVCLSSFYICRRETSTSLVNVLWGTSLGKINTRFTWDDWFSFIKDLRKMTGLDFDFPTEAQWEYAARGGRESQGYIFAGSNTLSDVWTDKGSDSPSIPNELGIYNMSDQFSEWCKDYYSEYIDAPIAIDPCCTAGVWHVLRGGNSNSTQSSNMYRTSKVASSTLSDKRDCRVSARGYGNPDNHFNTCRLVININRDK